MLSAIRALNQAVTGPHVAESTSGGYESRATKPSSSGSGHRDLRVEGDRVTAMIREVSILGRASAHEARALVVTGAALMPSCSVGEGCAAGT